MVEEILKDKKISFLSRSFHFSFYSPPFHFFLKTSVPFSSVWKTEVYWDFYPLIPGFSCTNAVRLWRIAMLSEITSTHSIFSGIYQSLLCQGESLKEQGITVPFASTKRHCCQFRVCRSVHLHTFK